MKKIIIVLLAVVALAVGGLFIFIMTFDVNQYKPELIEMVKAQTGRDFRIEGDLSIEPSFIPTVVVEGVYFGNASWASEKDMVRVERFEAVAELLPLLDNQLSIKKIVLIRPVISLEKNSKGKANWELELEASDAADSGDVPAFAFQQLSISHATVRYLEAGQEPQTYQIEKLTLGAKPSDSSLKLQLLAQVRDIPLHLNGSIGRIRHWMENMPYAVDLKGALADTELALKGSIEQPASLKGIHVQLAIDADSTSSLIRITGAGLAESGPLSVRLTMDDLGKPWTAEQLGFKYDLEGQLADLKLVSSGSIANLQQLQQVAVSFSLEADSTKLLEDLTERELPDIGALTLQGSLADLGAGIDRDNPGVKLDVKGGFADLSFSAAGQIGSLRQMRNVDLKVVLNADSTEQLIKLASQQFEPAGPLSFQARLADQAGTWKANEMSLRLGRSDLSGQLQFDSTGEIPSLSGKLSAKQIDLTEFLPVPEPDQTEASQPPAEKVFSAEPLPRDQLQQANIELDLQAGLFRTHQADLKNLQIGLKLKNGNLHVSPFRAGVLDSQLDALLTISANNPDVTLNFKLTGLEPTKLDKFKDGKEVQGARTDVDLQIRGRGASVAEIAGSGNGLLKVRVGEGKLFNSGLNLAGGDLLMGSISALNPLADKDPSTKLECAVINFAIKDGIASNEKAFAIQTEKLNILGGGSIDLKTEQIDITAKPKPREGIGLNLSGLAGVVGLGGTLANPGARADAVGVAKTAAKVGAALATGGLSVLAEGLFDRATVDDTICEVVLNQKQTGQTTAKSSSEAKPAEPKTASDNPVKDAGTALKGLFGQ